MTVNGVALAERETDSAGAIMEQVIAKGDLSKLNPGERASYYAKTCESMGLNPMTQPFQYVTLNGKLTLYATRTATDQLRKLHAVTLKVVSEETTADGLRVVRVRAATPDGREDEEIGAVHIGGLKGDALANAYMKALTKAKRRATLSICGLGWLDESEIETIPNARRAPVSGYVPDDEPVIDVAEAAYVVDTETGEVADTGDAIIAEFLDAIQHASTEDTLKAIGAELREAGISDQRLRDAWSLRAKQIAAAQPALIDAPAGGDPTEKYSR